MAWTTNIKRYRYTIIGFLVGVLIWGFGIWLEFRVERLPYQFWALAYIHRIQPLIITFDFAPVVLGLIGWLLDRQRNLFGVISRAKKEWETIFDSFADLIIVTDVNGRIIRCNHAVIDRLNTTFSFLIGKPIDEIFSAGQGSADVDSQKKSMVFPGWAGSMMCPLFPLKSMRKNGKTCSFCMTLLFV